MLNSAQGQIYHAVGVAIFQKYFRKILAFRYNVCTFLKRNAINVKIVTDAVYREEHRKINQNL